MIAVGKQHKKTKGSVLLAKDLKNKKEIYWLPDSEYPLIAPKGNPMDLIDGDWLLKNVFRKYSLGKKEIKMLINFYKNPSEVVLHLDDSWKIKAAFKALEDRMLHVLKTIYIDPTIELEPYHNPNRLGTVGFIAPSFSGKTFACSEIMLRDEFFKKKLYIFSPNAATDPSLAKLRQRPKNKTIFVDIDKIAGPLSLDMISKGSLVMYDDVFEFLSRDDPRRKWLRDFANVLMTKGRHWRKDAKSPGTGFLICSHVLKAGHDLKIFYTEIQGGLYLFPSNSPHQIVDFLNKKIGMNKLDINKILKLSRGSRWIMMKLSRPLLAMWQNGIILL